MGLYLHRSNRTERLADALAEAVSRPLRSVLQAEWITVSSPGMERWLSMELAKRLGVWANPCFPFPRKSIELALAALLSDAPEGALAYGPMCMTFALARLLQERRDTPGFEPVRRYCDDAQSNARRMALAQRLSGLFDQYVTYRPQLVLEWAQRGSGDDFQAELFASLVREYGPAHLAARAQAAVARLAAGGDAAGLPQRLHLFGISSLPPLYLTLLHALSEVIDVHVFSLSPCREYFGDLRSARERRAARQRQQLSFGEGFEPQAHALLASLGRHAREFAELLEERTRYVETGRDLYEDPGRGCVLHGLQSDLLDLTARGPQAAPRLMLSAADESVSIHACHTPMREVEVLHDQLAALICDAGVQPHEVIVMTPDIARYAPVIDAVFSQAQEHRPAIAFHIADRAPTQTEPLMVALLSLLDLLQSRFAANQVLDLLGIDLVRERFGIAPEQLPTLRTWVERSGIRWGVDAAHRAQAGQPALHANTWRFGLERLALGYCTGAAPDVLFGDTVPAAFEDVEPQLLGSLLELCETLFELRDELREPAPVGVWAQRLSRLVARCCALDEESPSAQRALSRALSGLAEDAARARFEEALSLPTLRELLAAALTSPSAAHGFLAGGVTFCQLLPMRSIPFKVLCLIGMSDGAFPASDTPFAFDLMQRKRQLGDRCRRDDDRQLFLEALLCARERLIVSYVGHSAKDGQPLPPSVLVSELVDHIADHFQLPGEPSDAAGPAHAQRVLERLVLHHPLSAASPRYFGAQADARLFSYSKLGLMAARARRRLSQTRAPAFVRAADLPEPEPELEVRLADLERCLMQPSREFCRRRLGLQLGRDLERLPEREPLSLDTLDSWQIASELLQARRRGLPSERAWRLERARCRLPPAAAGTRAQHKLALQLEALLGALASYADGPPLPAIGVDLQLGRVRLTGSLQDVWPAAQLSVRFSRAHGRHQLQQFVRHVVLQCVRQQQPQRGLPERSVLIARAPDQGVARVEFASMGDPFGLLAGWLELYTQALWRPLPLFQESSLAYAEKVAKDSDAALQAARWSFESKPRLGARPDAADPYVSQLYADFDQVLSLLPGAFERAAVAVYAPLLEGRRVT